MSLGEGIGVGFRGLVGVGFPVENEGKRGRVGRVGTGRPLASYPLVSLPDQK